MTDTTIHESGIHDVALGTGVTLIRPLNLYQCTIGNDTFVGPFTEVQSQVLIGERCKIQSHTFICTLVTIGDDVFVGHGVMFVNDDFSTGGPARGNQELWGRTTIGNRVSIGSNATILPVAICDDVVIGAGAVVTKNIVEAGTYVGNPARRMN